MKTPKLEIKLTFFPGLKEIVLHELDQQPSLQVIRRLDDSVYLDFTYNLTQLKSLRSVLRAYVIAQDLKYTPRYISNHKSILGDIIDLVTAEKNSAFETFKISCAGSGSPEVRGIADYIRETYRLIEKEKADIKVHIIKTDGTWEVGVEISSRPLFLRNYKVRNMGGAMDPTIAYAVNSLAQLEMTDSYLNIFSGSATLLIEAAEYYPTLKRLVGFDNDKDAITLAIQNIKKAGLMKRIQIKGRDLFDKPDLGKFDVITSDLPFGMLISKNDNLDELYKYFAEYCQKTLNRGGRLVVYTNNHKMLKKMLLDSGFKIINELELKISTSVNAYIYPKIFLCELNN